jgi:hypothetical protein
MKINQFYCSPCLSHLATDFKNLWDLKEYSNKYEPAIFLGGYNCDVQNINNHPGFKIVMICGADHPNIRELKNCKYILEDISMKKICESYGLKNLQIRAIKNYEKYKPVPLGDKIYAYIRDNGSGGRAYLDRKSVV